MTTMKPLSYLSLKCVLKHLGVDTRFHLYQKCPSIQSTEKLVPLKIDSLQLAPEEFQISGAGITYRLGIICQHHDEKTLRQMRWDEMSHDVDQYGFRLYNQDIEKVEGEVLVVYKESEDLRRERESQELKNLSNWEFDLERLENDRRTRSKWEQTPDVIRVLGKLDNKIKELKTKILPHHLRRDHAKPPYNHYLRLTITSKSLRRVELLAYNKRIHEAMRYLIEKLFGGRSTPTEVDKLKIRTYDVLRLPTNMQLKVQTMDIRWNGTNILNAIKPIIDNASFPLESFATDGMFPLEDPIIENAQKLIFWSRSSFRRLPELVHRRVHFHLFPQSKIALTVRHWLENGREIGTCFTFPAFQSGEVDSVMKEIKQIHGARIGKLRDNRQTQCVMFRINAVSSLYIYLEEVPIPLGLWRNIIFKMEVQPTGYAIPFHL